MKEEERLDALREISHIGAGNASKALSQMVGKKIDVEFPDINMVRIEEVAMEFGSPADMVTTVAINLQLDKNGDRKPMGEMLIIMKEKAAKNLSSSMLTGMGQSESKKTKQINESALKEMGNILTGSCLSAITEYVDEKFIEGVPEIAIDMLGSIIDGFLLDIAEYEDEVMVFKTEFSSKEEIDASFIIFFEPEAREIILDELIENMF